MQSTMRMYWIVGALLTTASSLFWATGSVLADEPWEDLSDRIEDKTDDLADVVDDDFRRSPDYRFLKQTADRIESIADDMDDDVDDEDWSCALEKIARLQGDLAMLQSVLAEQDVCRVRPKSMQKAMMLSADAIEKTACLAGMLSNMCGVPVLMPVQRGTYPLSTPQNSEEPIIVPVPPEPGYPILRPNVPMRPVPVVPSPRRPSVPVKRTNNGRSTFTFAPGLTFGVVIR